MSASNLPSMTMLGVGNLLSGARTVPEMQEYLRFLAMTVSFASQEHFDRSTFAHVVRDALAQRYPQDGPVSERLTEFMSAHIENLQSSIGHCLASSALWNVPAEANDPAFVRFQTWFMECASLEDETLATGLQEYLEKQPNLSELPLPWPLDFQVLPGMFPELTRVLRIANAQGGAPEPSYTFLFHTLREFMRIGMNCALVWKKYGPSSWDLSTLELPQLSKRAKEAGAIAVYDAWRLMMENPHAEAPREVRFLLGKCDILSAAYYFFDLANIITDKVDKSSLKVEQLDFHFCQFMMKAAERSDRKRFSLIRTECLGDPFTNPATFSALHRNICQMDAAFQYFGLPWPNSLVLPEQGDSDMSSDSESEDETDPFARADPNMIDDFFNNIDSGTVQPAANTVQVMEYETVAPVPHQAIGPVFNCSDFSTKCTDFAPEDLCIICRYLFSEDNTDSNPCVRVYCTHKFHMACLNGYINMPYPNKSHVPCPICRDNLCEARPTVARPDL